MTAPKIVFDREAKLLKFKDEQNEARQKKIDENKKLYGLFKLKMDYIDASKLDIEQMYIDNNDKSGVVEDLENLITKELEF